MKELDCWEALRKAFEYYNKDSITVYEFNMWSKKYQEDHPDVYIEGTKNDLIHEHTCGRIYWETNIHSQPNILHKQVGIRCPIDGTIHYKYPNVKDFEEIKKKIEFFEQQIEEMELFRQIQEDERENYLRGENPLRINKPL